MDVRLSAEQVALRDSATQVVERLGPSTVAQLDDRERTVKLDAAVEASGWRELRTATDAGAPWASAVEVAIVAEELGRRLADVPFVGPTLAAELRRLAGAPAAEEPETVALGPRLAQPVFVTGDLVDGRAVAVDARDARSALVLRGAAGAWTLAGVTLAAGAGAGADGDGDGEADVGTDLTRYLAGWEEPATPVEIPGQTRTLTVDNLARWHSLGLAVACADLVGVMRGALEQACDYARARKQYGATIGSFQAVQHMLADSFVSMEGSRSVALHAAWAVDALPGADALVAASVAKAYCGRAARAVCETAIQVHGGIGNTWDCLAHVYLRRALVSSDLLGDVGQSLDRVLEGYGVGGDRGLR